MEWEVILKWLPKLMQGATLTLELTAISSPPVSAPLSMTTSLPRTALGKTCTLILFFDFWATNSANFSKAKLV